MKDSIHQTLKLTAVAALACFAFTGCITQSTADYTSDGGNGLINQEAVSMGQVVTASKLAKSAATATVADSDTVTGEFNVTRGSATCPDSISGLTNPCFVRDAQFTSSNSNGTTFTRERKDTIWLVDSLGHYMSAWNPLLAKTLIHHRHVSKVKGTGDVELQFNTTLTWIDSAGVRMGLWTGTIVGSYDGVDFKNVTITGVKRPFAAGSGFGSPTSGDIKCQRGNFSIDIQFTGSGNADVIVTNEKNGKVHHVKVTGGVEKQTD